MAIYFDNSNITTGNRGPEGPQGPAGPNRITAATATDLNGIMVGDGTNVGSVAVLPVTMSGTGATNAAEARENLGITPANIGAAPAGYGLGVATSDSKDNDLNKATACGWYAFTSTALNRPFDYGSVMVTNRYENQITQMAFNPFMGSKGEMCVRHFTGINWTEWEYINPPMLLGVEYRTTERFDGKSVYVKLCEFGVLPNNTSKTVSNLYSAFRVLQADGYLANSAGKITPFEQSAERKYIDLTVNTLGDVIITTTRDASAYSAYIYVKYTKN